MACRVHMQNRSLNKINMKSESTSTRKCLPEALPIRGDQWFPDFSSLNGQIWNLNIVFLVNSWLLSHYLVKVQKSYPYYDTLSCCKWNKSNITYLKHSFVHNHWYHLCSCDNWVFKNSKDVSLVPIHTSIRKQVLLNKRINK